MNTRRCLIGNYHMFEISNYNPDVLSCLANLSSDEVFTPPEVVNQMLDTLPNEIWSDENATFLDVGTKSGVFLREIAKRLDVGLKDKIPDRQERFNHIMTKQIFGLAITELTALLARRSLYCSKTADGKYSVCTKFKNPDGNIRFNLVDHTWENGRCMYCGASKKSLCREDFYEAHAYEFIHNFNPNKVYNMTFDVIAGNPPYQLDDGGFGDSASPIYHKFIQQAIKLKPKYLSMIVPARWYAGGKGLDSFRKEMLNDRHITKLVDYPIASEVFPGVKVIGGICYFLWERDREADCEVKVVMGENQDIMTRKLNEHGTFVRFNKAISILKKIKAKNPETIENDVSSRKPFGLATTERPTGKGTLKLYATKTVGKYERRNILTGAFMLDKWKVLVSNGYGEGGESREYPRMIIGKPIIAPPNSACTETYIVVSYFETEEDAQNFANYLRTKFFRFCVGLLKNTQHTTKDRFAFVPKMDMRKKWDDKKLYKYFGLTAEEINFIETIVRPMETPDAE